LNGVYCRIKPIDHSQLGGKSPEEYFGIETGGGIKIGFPEYFDLFSDDSFRLYPAPGAAYVTLASGYRVWFKRTANLFAVATDTSADTVEPGFASPYHIILAYMAALPYCAIYHENRVAAYERIIGDFYPPIGLKRELIKNYNSRAKFEKRVMTMSPIRRFR